MSTVTLKQAPTVTRWYCAPGALAIRVQVQLFNDGSGMVGHWIVPAKRLFLTEREALEYALKHKKEAMEAAQRAYDDLLNQIDKMELREVEEEF